MKNNQGFKIFMVCIVLVWSLSFFMAVSQASELSLIDKVKNHPDTVQMGDDWYQVVIKENISKTEYDWRFDLRRIDVYNGHISIGHRFEQNSGNIPNSNWVVTYSFKDNLGDGTLDNFNQDRFISIEQNGSWLRISPFWPDEFRYPLLTKKEAIEQYKKELEYWNKIL